VNLPRRRPHPTRRRQVLAVFLGAVSGWPHLPSAATEAVLRRWCPLLSTDIASKKADAAVLPILIPMFGLLRMLENRADIVKRDRRGLRARWATEA
jgi:hypothetical protein